MKETQSKKRSLTKQVELFLIATASFLVLFSIVSGWVLTSQRTKGDFLELAKIEADDIQTEIHELADAFLLQTSEYIANTLGSYEQATDAQLETQLRNFGISELHLIDTNGVVVKSTVPTDCGWNMAKGEQSAEFLRLLHGEKSYAQPLKAKSNGGKLARYAAAVFPDGRGFAEIGLDEEAYFHSLSARARAITRRRHLRFGGYVLLADALGRVISAPVEHRRVVWNNLRTLVSVDLKSLPRDRISRFRVLGEDAYGYYNEIDGFSVLVVQPTAGLMKRQLELFGGMTLVSLLVSLLAFIVATIVLRQIVTTPVVRLAEALNRIIGGDYDAVADVRTSAEFESLTDNVNAAAAALKEHARQERERLIEVDKAKTLFFSSVSHDIRTPLNAILGFTELLQDEGLSREERTRDLRMIETNGRMLLELVNDILDLSKLEAGKMEIVPEPTDVRVLVQEILPVFGPQIGERHQSLYSDVPRLPKLMVDPHRIRQILFNLIGNAVKYAGSCMISVDAEYDACRQFFSLTVKDNGAGLSDDLAEKVMQPYAQAYSSDRKHGTGLGLAICKQLAKSMGGTFTLKTAPGMGCTFTLAVPAREVEELKVEKSGDVQRSTFNVQPSTRILVADDATMNRTMVKSMLAKLGVDDVTLVENGRKALEELRESSDYDWVLTDMWMPEMDGVELVKAIRADEKLAKLKVCTITGDIEARNTYRNQGFDALLLKPVTLKALKELFENA